jgi:hypothetical protein
MIKINGTIILLIILGILLGVYCTAGKSLMTGEYNKKLSRPIEYLVKTSIGGKLLKYYLEQINLWARQGLIHYHDGSEPPEKERAYLVMILTRVIFGSFVVVLTSFISIGVIFMEGIRTTGMAVSKRKKVLILTLIILNGLLIRLIMAATYCGNFDMGFFKIAADAALAGDNIYAMTKNYNYTPIWLMVLGGLKWTQLHFPAVTFEFMVKFFGCVVDTVSLAFLLLIAKNEGLSITRTTALFYLNPVSFLITGYHGQFENFAVLMILIGLWAYFKFRGKTVPGTALLWIFVTAGMIVKHNVFYELIICLNTAIKRYRIKLLLFAVSVCIFLATFIPYWSGGKEGIINNVFLYSAGSGRSYGIMSLFQFPPIKYIFIAGLFLFGLFLKDKDIIRNCLLGMLFFLAFITGISIQYFVLPIALGVLRPSKGFLLYSLAATLFLLGDVDNIYVPGFHLLGWNVVWLSVMYWFIIELKRSYEAVSGVTVSFDRFFT